MNSILVTGSSGFIGSNVLRNLRINLNNYKVFKIEEADLNVSNWVETTIEVLKSIQPKVIFHIGACSNTLETDVNYIMERNYEFTKIIMNYSSDNDTHVIYSSSAANYGDSGKYPSSLYGWSKYVAEDYVIKSGGIALRYFNVYGPGEEKKGDMASLAYQAFIKNKSGEKICLFPGKPMRDFIHVNDVVDANFYAMTNYETLKGNYYEVGTGIASSFEDMMLALGFDFVYASNEMIPTGYQNYTCSNIQKWMPRWKPNTNLKDGIDDYKKYLEEKH